MDIQRLMVIRDRIKAEIPIKDGLDGEVEYVGKKELCPFHNDRKPGSFTVNKRKNTYKCWACNKGGDIINFYMEKYGMTFIDALVHIAIKFGIATRAEIEEIMNAKIDETSNIPVRKPRDVIVDNRPKIASAEVLHAVYSRFAKGVTYNGKPILTEKHREKLHEDYGLSDEDIERHGFFTWPTSHIAKKFFADLMSCGISDTELACVPGLFYNQDTEAWDFYRPKNTGSIGMPIRNIDGKIVGLQIRLDRKKEGCPRYQWFSSAFADGKNTPFIKGSSPGSPVDVVYPKQVKNGAVFVTEGKFKAVKLANQFNSIVLSVQGVSNWRQIPAVMDELNRRYPSLRHVYIAYDADMAYKETVLSPAMKLGLTMTGLDFEGVKDEINDILKIGFKTEEESNLYHFKRAKKVADYLVRHPIHKYVVQFCLWDDRFGKGIDDLIKSGHIEDIKKMSLVPFWMNAFISLQAADKMRKDIAEAKEIPFQEVVLEEDVKRTLFQQHIFSKLSN